MLAELWVNLFPILLVMFISPARTLAVIFAAYLPPVVSIVNFFIFTLLVQTVFFVIIGIQVLLPNRSQAILDRMFAWLKKYLRVLAIVIFVGFGLFFLVKGLMGLAD